MSYVVKAFMIKLDQYIKLKEISKRSGRSLSMCIRDAILSTIEGKIKPVPNGIEKSRKKMTWFKINEEEYYEFMNTCTKLGYNSFSGCIRDVIGIWINLNDHLDESSIYQIKKGKTATKTVIINKEDYKKLSAICGKFGYSSETKCVREALLLFMNRKDRNIDKYNEEVIWPYKAIKVRVRNDEYLQIYNECQKVGFESFSQCVRYAIKLWLNEQKMVN